MGQLDREDMIVIGVVVALIIVALILSSGYMGA